MDIPTEIRSARHEPREVDIPGEFLTECVLPSDGGLVSPLKKLSNPPPRPHPAPLRGVVAERGRASNVESLTSQVSGALTSRAGQA